VEKEVAGDGCKGIEGAGREGEVLAGLFLEGGPTTSAAGDWTARAAGRVRD
jgi:hypothetical protein